MEFDKSRVFTAVNADELRVGDKVIVANCISMIKAILVEGIQKNIKEINEILGEGYSERFHVGDNYYAIAYLVERKENCTNCKYGSCVSCSIRPEEEKKIYKCKNYIKSCVSKKDKKTKEPPLAMWEAAVCEIRAEIRSHDKDDTMSYAIAICDALENSMVQFAKNEDIVNVDFEQCFDTKDNDRSEVIVL